MIVLSYSSGHDCEGAVAWAARAAIARDVPLTVVSVAGLPAVLGDASYAAPLPADMFTESAQAIAEEGAAKARELGVKDVTAHGATGDTARAVVEFSKDAELVVVGSRGRGQLLSALLGSVSYEISAHAHCPVVVVRRGASIGAENGQSVVVGVDGSEGSQIAVDFAAGVAARSKGRLTLVTVWRDPIADGLMPVDYSHGDTLLQDIKKQASSTLHHAADKLRETYPDLSVETVLVEGLPADALLKAADGADLIVTGSRGRGGFGGLLLGSVSHGVLHHAKCAVAIAR